LLAKQIAQQQIQGAQMHAKKQVMHNIIPAQQLSQQFGYL
jgi:hypothetical protein